jgi:Zn-dependent protease
VNRFGPLYYIDHVGALAGFVVGAGLFVLLRGMLQARIASALGDGTALQQGRGKPDLRRHVEVYGVVAWALAGFTWGTPALYGWRSAKRTRIITSLVGPLVGFALTVGWVTVARILSDPGAEVSLMILFGAITTAGCAVLACVPVPPLDGWTFLRAVTRVTPGLERARHQLEDRNIGLAVTVGLVVLPRLFVSLPDPLYSLAGRLIDLATTVTGG